MVIARCIGSNEETVVERTGTTAATPYRIEHGRPRPQTRTLRTFSTSAAVRDQEQKAELVPCYATHGSAIGSRVPV